MQSAQIANGSPSSALRPDALSSAPESLKDSGQRWWLLALLFTVMVFAYAQRGTLSVANKSVAQTLHLNPAEMGLLQSAFFWVYAFTQMPAGWIVQTQLVHLVRDRAGKIAALEVSTGRIKKMRFERQA